jgi:hypothetical protein
MVMASFVFGTSLAAGMLVYETRLAHSGLRTAGAVRLGRLSAPPAFYGILLGYGGALLSGGFDELWHRIYGIDARLWSPPHLLIMLFTMVVDYSLLLGLATSAGRLGWKFDWRNPFFWTLTLVGAYTFEVVNFQMAEAFLIGYEAHGGGLLGLLFPILVGSLFPMSLLLTIKLARNFGIAGLVFLVGLCLHLVGVSIAGAGFAVLKPVSEIETYILLNPDSTIAMTRQLASQIGFKGLIGYQQAWLMILSGAPLGIVSILSLVRRARRRQLIAASLYSASLVLVSFLWFRRIPVLRAYNIPWWNAVLGVAIAAVFGLITGWIGIRISALVRGSEQRTNPAEGTVLPV